MTRAWRIQVPMALIAWMICIAATPYDEAARLYESGKYLEAASLAAAIDTAPSLALSARATLVHAIYVADRSTEVPEFQSAEDNARRALTLDPNHVEAHLQLVIALHRKASALTLVDTYFKGYAAEARSHLDTALKLDPDNPWAHSLLAGWHYEIVRLAGTKFASFLWDANLEQGCAAFTKAIALLPTSIVLRYEFARALLLSDSDACRVRAINALETALGETPRSHLEKLISVRARVILKAIKAGSPEQLRRILDADR